MRGNAKAPTAGSEFCKLQVKQVRIIKERDVLLRVQDEGDVRKFKGSKDLATAELVVDSGRRYLPQMIIYDVPTEVSEANLTSCLSTQNGIEEDLENEINFVCNAGSRDKIAEVSPAMRQALLTKQPSRGVTSAK